MATRLQAFWVSLLTIICVRAGDTAEPARKPPIAQPDGTIETSTLTVPFSTFASEDARNLLLDRIARPPPVTPGNVQKTRQDIDEQFHKPLLQALHSTFAVTIFPQLIGGVPTEVIAPAEGVAPKNRSRVLLNLHGGGFQLAARLGGQIEAIPIAALGRIKVIAVDYRQGPEHKFPAGSEDAASVYKDLLKTYRPENIGIYGCSAGGILTSEALAWFQAHSLPSPGAVGIFSAGALAYAAGDSVYVGAVLSGKAAPAPNARPSGFKHYFGEADLNDPLVSPVHSAATVAKFPATLIISGGRDTYLSSALYTHRQLVKAGVDADLHVWEGLGHCFFFNPQLPESREAWNVIVNFFDRHLGERS